MRMYSCLFGLNYECIVGKQRGCVNLNVSLICLWYAGPPYICMHLLSVQQCYLTASPLRLAYTELIIICVSGYVRLCLYKWDRALNAAGSDIPLRNETFHQGPGVGFCRNEGYLSLVQKTRRYVEHNEEQTGWLQRRQKEGGKHVQ